MSTDITPAAPDGVQGVQLDVQKLPLVLRPHRNLLTYNLLTSLLLGPFFIFGFLPLYFRFRSLRYELDEEGITMRWGILFRREISLTYARIQDIHLSSNFVERWLDLARIQIQTASGSASAEMTIEGVPAYEQMRNFLYTRMRGVRHGRPPSGPSPSEDSGSEASELVAALRATTAELRAIREELRGAMSRGGDRA